MTVHEKRASFVDAQIQSYAKSVGLDLENDGVETVVGDMIADLLHYAVSKSDSQAAEALDVAATGIMHFTAQSQVAIENYQMDIGPEVGVSLVVEFADQQWTAGFGQNVEVSPPTIR
jgi:hypothetical protein